MQRLLLISLLFGFIISVESVPASVCAGRQCFVDGLCNTTIYNDCGCKKGYRFSNGLNDTCVDQDECFHHIHDPCGHRGRCINTVGDYICQCLEGWEQNSSRCLNNVTDHPRCMPGYKGYLCQIAECGRHGFPETKGIGEKYECICEEGWTRTTDSMNATCDLDINECEEIPGICQHGATCVNLDGSYKCQCPTGWVGVNCTQVNCTSRGCVNGVCVDGECRCSSPWTGDDCSSLLTSVVTSTIMQPDANVSSLSGPSSVVPSTIMQPDANVSSLSGPSSVVPSTIMQPDANVSSLSGPSDKERDTYSIPFFVSIALAAGLLIGLGIAMYLLVRFKKRARDVETNKEDTTKTLGSKCQIHPTDDVQT